MGHHRGVKCALCLAEVSRNPGHVVMDAETQIGPLPVCGGHVEAALVEIGYRRDSSSSPVVAFLESVDPKELESAAMELVGSYSEGETTVGRAFLSVLLESAKAQAAG